MNDDMQTLHEAIKKMQDADKYTDSRAQEWHDTIMAICEHYAEKLGLKPIEVFEALERRRDYWYPNFYQWGKYPRLDGKDVYIVKDRDELQELLHPEKGFRCPRCNGVSKDHVACNSGVEVDYGKGQMAACNWKAYGLFGTMGLGIYVLVVSDWLSTDKDANPSVHQIFKPVHMEVKEA